ncbi:MAG: hypothetical protein AAF798_10780 [Bacteroidota bacterium]
MSKPLYTDQQVLKGIRANEQRMITYFYDEMKAKTKRSFGSAVRQAGSPQAEAFKECFSLAFLCVIRKIQHGAYQDGNLRGFAYRIIYNHFNNQWRNAQKHQHAAADCLLELALPEKSPCENIVQLFEQLPTPHLFTWSLHAAPEHLQLLNWRLQGYGSKEVAQMRQQSDGTIRNEYSKIMQTIKAIAQQTNTAA